MSRVKAISVIKSLIEKKLIAKKTRISEDGDNTSNIYYILDIRKEVVHDVNPNNININNNNIIKTRVRENTFLKDEEPKQNTTVMDGLIKHKAQHTAYAKPYKNTYIPQQSNFNQNQFSDNEFMSMFDNLRKLGYAT